MSEQGSSSGGDWKEEVYQKINSMNEMYFHELNELYQRMAAKLQEHDAVPQQPYNEQLEKLRFLKVMLERFILFLHTGKNEVQTSHRDKIVRVEKLIVDILNSSRGDWKEEVYERIQSMNEKYYLDLNEMHQRFVAKLQEHEAIPQHPKNEQLEKLRFLKVMLERLILFLHTGKNEVKTHHRDTIDRVGKQILNILYSSRPRR